MRIAIDDGGGLNLWVLTLSELHHIDQRFVMGCVAVRPQTVRPFHGHGHCMDLSQRDLSQMDDSAVWRSI